MRSANNLTTNGLTTNTLTNNTFGPETDFTKASAPQTDYSDLFATISRLAADVSASADRLATSSLKLLARIGENSPGARAAEKFQKLNALSDQELAARGLRRDDLLFICFSDCWHN
jgi:hypothetical protein